jgi:integrase
MYRRFERLRPKLDWCAFAGSPRPVQAAISRWLWRDGRAREHALALLATSHPEADRRRALTPEEATRLVETAAAGPAVLGRTGPDRALAYRVALGTGFRSAELASLTPERFRLDGNPPTIVSEAGDTKNGGTGLNHPSRTPWRACHGPGWSHDQDAGPSLTSPSARP